MVLRKRIGALLLMAGEGSRLGNKTPKQFVPLMGKSLYLHALKAIEESGLFDEVVLVSHPEWLDLPHERVVSGGSTRQESSYLGLQNFQKPLDIVLIHDAVRPFVSQRILKENVEKAIHFGAVDTCIPSSDTIVQTQDGLKILSIPPREHSMRGQTPQTFRMDWIVKAHEKALLKGVQNATDDCQLILAEQKEIHIVLGDEKNFKITTQQDLWLAEQLLESSSS